MLNKLNAGQEEDGIWGDIWERRGCTFQEEADMYSRTRSRRNYTAKEDGYTQTELGIPDAPIDLFSLMRWLDKFTTSRFHYEFNSIYFEKAEEATIYALGYRSTLK